MTDPVTLRQTPLYDEHLRAGGRMVEFAGWSLPVQFAGVVEEHLAVRRAAGLFDVSHMGEAVVRGPQAQSLLQRLTCNDVARLVPGRAQYTALTTVDGTFVDDLVLYRLADEEFLLVLNAANTSKDLTWLRTHAEGLDVEVLDASADWAQIALQGPRALSILAQFLDGLTEIRYYGFRRLALLGAECLVSRTGYTGEDGFEIYCPHAAAPAIWRTLISSGAGYGLVPVGLAARDTLRLEARMPLYGNDIDETTTVLEADLGWIAKMDKGDFLGREVLAVQSTQGTRRRLVGFQMQGRSVARAGHRAWFAGVEAGLVTSGSYAPFLERNIGLVYLPTAAAAEGKSFEVELRGRREPAVVVRTPFYRRQR